MEQFKTKLSKSSYKLLCELVNDLHSTHKPEDRVYRKQDNPSLIYNLFNGNYGFSFNNYKEIITVLYSK